MWLKKQAHPLKCIPNITCFCCNGHHSPLPTMLKVKPYICTTQYPFSISDHPLPFPISVIHIYSRFLNPISLRLSQSHPTPTILCAKRRGDWFQPSNRKILQLSSKFSIFFYPFDFLLYLFPIWSNCIVFLCGLLCFSAVNWCSIFMRNLMRFVVSTPFLSHFLGAILFFQIQYPSTKYSFFFLPFSSIETTPITLALLCFFISGYECSVIIIFSHLQKDKFKSHHVDGVTLKIKPQPFTIFFCRCGKFLGINILKCWF